MNPTGYEGDIPATWSGRDSRDLLIGHIELPERRSLQVEGMQLAIVEHQEQGLLHRPGSRDHLSFQRSCPGKGQAIDRLQFEQVMFPPRFTDDEHAGTAGCRQIGDEFPIDIKLGDFAVLKL